MVGFDDRNYENGDPSSANPMTDKASKRLDGTLGGSPDQVSKQKHCGDAGCLAPSLHIVFSNYQDPDVFGIDSAARAAQPTPRPVHKFVREAPLTGKAADHGIVPVRPHRYCDVNAALAVTACHSFGDRYVLLCVMTVLRRHCF